MIIESAVAQLNCDSTCVSPCTAAALTIDAKAACLDTCKCYATPAVIVPATPVVAPATPVAAPATPVAAPTTPVVAPATPVVTDSAIPATPNVADAAAVPAAPVIVNAEPASEVPAQALFLSEANLVHSATGALSGAFIVALILVCMTLLGAAFLHLKEKGEFEKIGAKLWNLRKGAAASNENEEYLLIK